MTGGRTGRRLRAVPMGSTTTVIDQAQALANYPEAFLVCRESHRLPLGTKEDHWDEEHDEGGRVFVGWKRVMMCERCHAIVRDRLDSTGKMTRHVKLPDGYRIPRDVGGYVTRRGVRLERVRRIRSQAATG